MNSQHDPSQLHRLMKIAIDSGQVSSIAEAERLFSGYRLAIQIGEFVEEIPDELLGSTRSEQEY